MKVVYRDEQTARGNTSFSPSAGKPALFVDMIKSDPDVEIFSDWEPLTRDDLYLVHDREHVDAILECRKPNGFGNNLKAVADSLLFTSGSFYHAARIAIREGVAISPTSGFHHSCYASSGGFCTFNGLMAAAVLIYRAGLVDRIGIIDFDAHWGNGTVDIIQRLGIKYIDHMSFTEHYPRDHDLWLKGLYDSLSTMFCSTSILFYQAGADPHVDDPLGGSLTTEKMRLRDRIVFEYAHARSIPIVWNLAGGYQNPIEKVLSLHNNTFMECKKLYGSNRNDPA
jgi:acetoin utilization deacetylase AcuC-like enzyme